MTKASKKPAQKTGRNKVYISKTTRSNNGFLFWWDINGGQRRVVTGSREFVDRQKAELVLKYKDEIIILRK